MAFWQEREDQLLIREWKNGSCGICRQIAAMLGRSRNSVIGRGRRLGLPFLKRKQRIKPPRVVRLAARIGPPVLEGRMPYKEIPVAQLWVWAEKRTHLVDVEPNQCRWPVGEMEYCGGKRSPDSPYCAAHSRLAFHKANGRFA